MKSPVAHFLINAMPLSIFRILYLFETFHLFLNWIIYVTTDQNDEYTAKIPFFISKWNENRHTHTMSHALPQLGLIYGFLKCNVSARDDITYFLLVKQFIPYLISFSHLYSIVLWLLSCSFLSSSSFYIGCICIHVCI